jgi:hypothetical protein
MYSITEAIKLIRGPASRAEKFQLQTKSGCSLDKPDGDVGITDGGAQLRRGSGPVLLRVLRNHRIKLSFDAHAGSVHR